MDKIHMLLSRSAEYSAVFPLAVDDRRTARALVEWLHVELERELSVADYKGWQHLISLGD